MRTLKRWDAETLGRQSQLWPVSDRATYDDAKTLGRQSQLWPVSDRATYD